MTRIAKTLCLLAATGLWQGCSSSGDSADGSKSDTGTGGDTSSVFLSRGMNSYKITAVTAVTDGCDVGASTFVDVVLPVNFVEATRTLSVGNQQGVPLQASLGSGVISTTTTGTLDRANDTTDGTCTWHTVTTSEFTLTGVDVFTLEVTEMQSAFTTACDPIPAGGMCTSTYTLTFAKVAAAADGGTGG